jgi:hypothetical protein
MNQKQAKIVLILMTIILFLIFVLTYIQAISIEHFSNNNLESFVPGTFSSPINSNEFTLPSNNRGAANVIPKNNFIMTHDTVLDEYDIINPILTPDDVIYQTTKYHALMENGWNNDFSQGRVATRNAPSSGQPSQSPSFGQPSQPSPSPSFGQPSPSPSFGKPSPSPSFGKPSPTTKKSIVFPCTVVVSYSNYKDKKSGLDPFLNKTINVLPYDRFFAAYPIKNNTGAMYFPGIDEMYSLWALSVSNNSIICGWHQQASDKAPVNKYPNKLILYVKNVL